MARKLRPEERALWDRVRETAAPLKPAPLVSPIADLPVEVAPVPLVKTADPIPSFRIGSRARAGAALPVAKPYAPVMDGKTFGKMTRGKLAPEARIDLHGMTVAEAHPELINFIMTSAQRQMRLVLVITGKGRARDDHGPIPERVGVLRQSLPRWLRQPPLNHLVMDATPAHQKHGGGGAFYVYLRRKR